MTGIISFIVMFGLLIFVHELGHFAVAKLAGVSVEEFGFGYPPRLLTLGRWRETLITLNVLPLGGFVRMNEDDPSVPGSLANKSRRVRALVFASGALMNVLLAVVLFSVTYMIGALTPVQAPGAGVYYIAPDSPAQMAGIAPGDTIVSINGVTVGSVEEAINLIQDNVGEPTELLIRRDDATLPPLTVTPRENPPEGEGALGVALDLPLVRQSYPFWEAIPLGFRATYNTVLNMYYGIRAAIVGELPFEVTGPVGIYQRTVEVAKTGIERLIEFTAFLSVNLFLLNLLPLPALDGGRLLFVGLEWVRGGRRIPPEKEGLVHAIGMALLLVLMALVTFADVRRYFG